MWDIDFTGIGVEAITLLAEASLTAADEGKVAKISTEKEAGPCDAEDVFYGVISKYDQGGGVVALDRKGFKTVAYTGSIAPGYKELVANGAGGVKAPATPGAGRMYYVVSVDAGSGTLVMDLG